MTIKSPAFQWYPKDILASLRVQEMSLEEEGAYRRALDFCWLNGSLPNDLERLARIIGKGASTTVARVVQEMFDTSEDGTRLIHPRLEEERAKQKEWAEKSRAGGLLSAERRRQKKIDEPNGKGGSTTLQPPLEGSLQNGINQNATLQSSSSSSSAKKEKNIACARVSWLGEAQTLLTKLFGGLGATEAQLLDQQIEQMAAKTIRGSPVTLADVQRFVAEKELPQVRFLASAFSAWVANQNREKHDVSKNDSTHRNEIPSGNAGNLRAYESKPKFEPTEGRL